jgi:hypothetical protein
VIERTAGIDVFDASVGCVRNEVTCMYVCRSGFEVHETRSSFPHREFQGPAGRYDNQPNPFSK